MDVVNELSKKYVFDFWLIGDGELKEEIIKKITQYRLANVKVLGKKDNPYPFMRVADCFVSSALWESFGLAIQESFVMGVPVIAAECPAINEVVDSKMGIITQNSFNGLKQAMEMVLKKPHILNEYKRNIKSNYNCDRLYEDRLKDICSLWEE